jgi:hypothetical protein
MAAINVLLKDGPTLITLEAADWDLSELVLAVNAENESVAMFPTAAVAGIWYADVATEIRFNVAAPPPH